MSLVSLISVGTCCSSLLSERSIRLSLVSLPSAGIDPDSSLSERSIHLSLVSLPSAGIDPDNLLSDRSAVYSWVSLPSAGISPVKLLSLSIRRESLLSLPRVEGILLVKELFERFKVSRFSRLNILAGIDPVKLLLSRINSSKLTSFTLPSAFLPNSSDMLPVNMLFERCRDRNSVSLSICTIGKDPDNFMVVSLIRSGLDKCIAVTLVCVSVLTVILWISTPGQKPIFFVGLVGSPWIFRYVPHLRKK